jgi:hypothetical protein
MGFIKPKRWNQALREDVEQFLNLLLREGKAGCPQDSKALDLFFREVAPMDLSRHGCSVLRASPSIYSLLTPRFLGERGD